MRSHLFAALVLLGLLGLLGLGVPAAHADLGAFTIETFDVVIDVLSNSDIVVEERIVVDFSQPRRGIYREIPIRYTDPRGYQYGYDFRLLGVENAEGRPWQTKTSRDGAVVRVRIGSPDRTVTGHQTYVIRYRARDVLRSFSEHDELYWNVTGHLWNTTIGSASVRVRLPDPFERDQIDIAAWAGRYGSREENARVAVPEPGIAEARTTEPLAKREGLTIAVAWPPGSVAFPGFWERAGRFLGMNGILLAPVLVFFFLRWRYRKTGRDPEVNLAVPVRYEPPPGVSPGLLGAVFDETVDTIDITSTIVDLAIRGYLRIETAEREGVFGLGSEVVTVFVRVPEKSWEGLEEHEELILNGIFEGHGDRVTTEDLREEFYTRVPLVQSALYDALVEKGLSDASPRRVRGESYFLAAVLAGTVFMVGLLLTTAQGAVPGRGAIVPTIAAALTLAIGLAFARAMPRRTRKGVEVLEWALGFQDFVRRVKSHELEEAAARQAYERLLPYAMVLGVAKTWSRRFEDIYATDPPSWYVGPMRHGHGPMTSVDIERTLSSSMKSAGTALTTAPRSSSSSGFGGGGGFSGGGGGGGGGGSW